MQAPSAAVCAICRDIFTRPQRLPCSHIFCEACIIEWISSGNSSRECRCPLCGRSCKIPDILADPTAEYLALEAQRKTQPPSNPVEACTPELDTTEYDLDRERAMKLEAKRLEKLEKYTERRKSMTARRKRVILLRTLIIVVASLAVGGVIATVLLLVA